MPRKDRTTQDPRTFIKLADGKPLMVAVPKTYLRILAGPDHAGSVAALARRLEIDRSTLSQWISGQKEMPNEQVLNVATRLNVSPLCVLDLASYDAHEAPDAMATRAGLLEDLAALRELEAGHDARADRHQDLIAAQGREGAVTVLRGHLLKVSGVFREPSYRDLIAIQGREGAAKVLRGHLLNVSGDYRDLAALIRDAASRYRTTTRPDYLLQQMFEAWQLHGWDSQG